MVNMKCHMKCEHRSCRAKDVFYKTDNCLETDNSVLETKIYTAKYNKSNYIPSVSLYSVCFSNSPKYAATVKLVQEETKHPPHKFTAACYPILYPCRMLFGKHKTLQQWLILISSVVEFKSQRNVLENTQCFLLHVATTPREEEM